MSSGNRAADQQQQQQQPLSSSPPPSSAQKGSAEAVPPQFTIAKTFPPRGGMQQYRLDKSHKFTCGRCQKDKTAKLVVVREGWWEQLWCNGCYGEVLAKG
ncbi:uncharacterized protein GGS25DRAFT_491417 [Hypoxylon fragiforme]|uniref:uncharacterized protein n=1 Tax=Hypoxylon fragiforme TaxID=63214 RepID=UPI0020C65EC8|nr:uncharacterized protein GGS25DRAFT_491417 [Hypoxylon fragiforme]KAI2608731.1 hypothetical protein GGS25DRAFT_491417 [Hypoxylon fragiforme]